MVAVALSNHTLVIGESFWWPCLVMALTSMGRNHVATQSTLRVLVKTTWAATSRLGCVFLVTHDFGQGALNLDSWAFRLVLMQLLIVVSLSSIDRLSLLNNVALTVSYTTCTTICIRCRSSCITNAHRSTNAAARALSVSIDTAMLASWLESAALHLYLDTASMPLISVLSLTLRLRDELWRTCIGDSSTGDHTDATVNLGTTILKWCLRICMVHVVS